MNKNSIIKLPHSSLRQKSASVGTINDESKNLVKEMISATLDWEESREHEVGVALAAVQVNDLRRVVIIREDFDNKENKNFDVLINPKITKAHGEIIEDYEGCLSIRDVYGKVPRFSKVSVKAKTITGKQVNLKAEGFLARVLQHEIDHTNGIMFVDHIKDSPENFSKLDNNGRIVDLSDDERKTINSILW